MSAKVVDKFTIRCFEPRKALRKPFNMVVIGKKASGKSTFMRDILHNLYSLGYPRIVVFSGTEINNRFYSAHIPPQYIHYELDLETLANILSVQKQIHSAVVELEARLKKPTGIDTRLVIVLDDIVYQRGILSNDLFRLIFFQGRHYGVSLIVASQYLMYTPIESRPNIDFLVITKETIPKNRAKLYENFFGTFPDKNTFSYVLDRLTQNYEVCIHDSTINASRPDQQVFYYKAKLEIPPFMFRTLLYDIPEKFTQKSKGTS